MRIFLICIFLCSFSSLSQIDSATTKQLNSYNFGGVYKSSVSATVLCVAGVVGVSYELLLSQRWRFEVGVGYRGTGFAFDLYPWPVKRGDARFRMSLKNQYIQLFGTGLIIHSVSPGFTFFSNFKWNFGLDVGAAYAHEYDSIGPYDPVPGDAVAPRPVQLTGSFKAGYRFSYKYLKRKRELDKKNDKN